MSLTRVDCYFYRSPRATPETSSFVALNPSSMPGSFVVASSSAVRESIGSQVACKLALEHFIDGVLNFFERNAKKKPHSDSEEFSAEVLESAFITANSSVYSFGHRLAAGGRMAASLLGLVVQGDTIAAGRVGFGSAYLYRKGELLPFFEPQPPEALSQRGDFEGFIGAKSVVSVELASVVVEPADRLFAFSKTLDPEMEDELAHLAATLEIAGEETVYAVTEALFDNPAEISFAMVAGIGPDTIYLSNAVS